MARRILVGPSDIEYQRRAFAFHALAELLLRNIAGRGHCLLAGGAAPGLDDPSDVERVLLVWRHSFRQTWEMGRSLFGDRYRLVQHEALIANPGPTAEAVLHFAGHKADPAERSPDSFARVRRAAAAACRHHYGIVMD